MDAGRYLPFLCCIPRLLCAGQKSGLWFYSSPSPQGISDVFSHCSWDGSYIVASNQMEIHQKKVCSRGFSPSILNAPNRDLKIRRRRVSTTAVASWGECREVWKITLRTLVEDAVGFITGFRFFSENMAVTFSSKVLIKEEEDFQGRIPSSLRCKHLEKPRFPLRRRHDSSMLPDSCLLRDLERHGFSTTRESMAVYGNPAYPLRVHLQFPYIGAGITPLLLWSVAKFLLTITLAQ